MDLAIVFVRPCSIGEQAINRRVHLFFTGFSAEHSIQPLRKLIPAGRQVFGDIIQNLRPKMPGGFPPSFCALRRFDGVAYVLAPGQRHVAQQHA